MIQKEKIETISKQRILLEEHLRNDMVIDGDHPYIGGGAGVLALMDRIMDILDYQWDSLYKRYKSKEGR